MFCGKCGTRNPDVNKFCRECGAKLPERPNRTLSEEQFADLHPPAPTEPVDHDKVAALMDLAFSYHRDGQTDQAIATCLEAIALNDESTSAHSLLALLYEEKGQFDEAVAHQRRVLELNPDSVADQVNLARLLGEAAPGGSPAPLGSSLAARLLSPQVRPLVAATAAALVVLVSLLAYVLPKLRAEGETKRAALDPPAHQTTPFGATPYPGASWAPAPSGSPAGAAAPAQMPAAAAPAASPLEEEPDLGPPVPAARPEAPAPAPRRQTASSSPQMPPLPPELPDSDGPLEDLPVPPSRTVASPPVILVPTPQGQQQQQLPQQQQMPPPAPAAPQPAPPMEMHISTGPAEGQPPAAPPPPRAVLRVHEPTPADHEKWALAASAKGEYESAVSYYQKALDGARTPRERGKLHQQMAYAYQQLGRVAEAQAQYRQAIAQYQEQIKEGSNAEMARVSIRACEEGLKTLGM
ncbi:MAG: tetratricopeptide repeat protein [Armatimonadetes bacterium]|nr:tetratricopeptide repeat protein [Armatimonadota bacterium]